MDLSYTPDEEAFRTEVRTWLDSNLPTGWRHRGVGGYREEEDEDIQREWQRRLYEGGWLTLAWPKERGGRGATPVMQAIYAEEVALAERRRSSAAWASACWRRSSASTAAT